MYDKILQVEQEPLTTTSSRCKVSLSIFLPHAMLEMENTKIEAHRWKRISTEKEKEKGDMVKI